MGGCASRPKDKAVKAETIPEAPVSPKEANNVSHQDEGVETQQAGDAPVEDSSESKKEGAAAAAVSAEAHEEPKEEMAAAAATETKPEETKVEESKAEESKVEGEEVSKSSGETMVEAVVKTED